MKVEFVATENLSDWQQNRLEQLRNAVYPPEVIATLPGKLLIWAKPQWSILLWDGDEIVSRIGLLVRDVFHESVSKRIGGISGVMTHPAKQGKGFASQGMREAGKRFDEELNVSYALLFCRPHLVPFYGKLNWKRFEGKVFVEQPKARSNSPPTARWYWM